MHSLKAVPQLKQLLGRVVALVHAYTVPRRWYRSCTAQCFHILTACLYHLVLKHACLIIFLDSCGATILSVWPGGAAKARGSHHNALVAQQQHSSMRNEDQYLIHIYSQGALACN